MQRSNSIRARVGRLMQLLGGAVMLALVGCDVPAQIVWSPDGSQAAYRAGSTALLLNEQGIVLQPLGASSGGFVWSADSKSLFVAAGEHAGEQAGDQIGNTPTPLHLEWLGPVDDPAARPTTKPADEPKSITAVNVLKDGKVTPLFRLADDTVWYLQLSPDGQWLAVGATADQQDSSTNEFQLFVYSLHGGKLYELSRFCGCGACFVGPNTLAFNEASALDPVGQVKGHIVEVKLDEAAATLPRQTLLQTIVPLTGWMEPCKGGLLFTAAPRTFPAPPVADSQQPVFKLFHFSLADCGLTVLADDVGELFEASPDGKRILFERLTQPEPPAAAPATTESAKQLPTSQPPQTHDDLCVMNANGSDPHVLRSLDEYIGNPQPPMWPSWRGNDQITFIASAVDSQTVKVADHDRKVVNVIQYHLTDKGTLEALQSLSGDWKVETKPYFHRNDAK
jgi:hypothetical protein